MPKARKKKPQRTSPAATATAGRRCSRSEAANPHRLSARGGGLLDAGEVAMVRRSSIAPLLVCGLCGGILREPTTVSECLHSFCGKCIYENFKDEDNKRCPTCNIDLGCDPMLRVDRNLQGISSVIFPAKRKMEEFASLHPELGSLPSLASQANEAYHSDATGTSLDMSRSTFLENLTKAMGTLDAFLLNLQDRSREKSARLALAGQEVADLRTQVTEAQERAREAEDKLAALAERAREDAAALRRLEGERDAARRERDDAVSLAEERAKETEEAQKKFQHSQWRVANLWHELESEKTRKTDAEARAVRKHCWSWCSYERHLRELEDRNEHTRDKNSLCHLDGKILASLAALPFRARFTQANQARFTQANQAYGWRSTRWTSACSGRSLFEDAVASPARDLAESMEDEIVPPRR